VSGSGRVAGLNLSSSNSNQSSVLIALTNLALACRKDSVKELQLSPEEEKKFEENAKVVGKIFVPEAPKGIRLSPDGIH
jgi:uncharacterized protein (DUF1800 family)